MKLHAVLFIGLGIAASIAFAEIGFFTSLMLGIPLPAIGFHGLLIVMARGFIVSCVLTVVSVIVIGLMMKARDAYEGE